MSVCLCVCVCFVFHRWHQTLGSLIRSHRKCAFHLPFLQVASVRLVSDTSFLADNTRGLNQHFPPVKTVPLFRANIIVNLSTCVYLQPSIKLILMSHAAVKWVSPSYHPTLLICPPTLRPPPPGEVVGGESESTFLCQLSVGGHETSPAV